MGLPAMERIVPTCRRAAKPRASIISVILLSILLVPNIGKANSAHGAHAPVGKSQEQQEDRDTDEIRRRGLLLYGYQPIFSSLTSAEGDWRHRILGVDAGSLFSRETVDDTLLFLVSAEVPDLPRLLPDPVATREFCSSAFAGQVDGAAELRRFALCAARFPGGGEQRADAISAELIARATPSGIGAAGASAALDALLVYRALRFCECGTPESREGLLTVIERTLPAFATAYLACPSMSCVAAEAGPLLRYTAVSRGVIFAALESPDLVEDPRHRELLLFAASREIGLPMKILRTPIANFMAVACAGFDLSYNACRVRYPYNNYLTAATLKMVSSFILAKPSIRRCATLLEQIREIGPELKWDVGLKRAVMKFDQMHCRG